LRETTEVDAHTYIKALQSKWSYLDVQINGV
jgi:hypothetical protein